MLSGGPFDLDNYPKAAELLLQATLDDSSISKAEKKMAKKDFDFCDELYVDYVVPGTVDVKLLRTTYLEQRKRIDKVARKLLRS